MRFFAFLRTNAMVVKLFADETECRKWVRSANSRDGFRCYGWAKEIA